MFYMVFPSYEARSEVIAALKKNCYQAVFHYLSLHKSEYYKNKHDGRELPNADRYTDCLARLPLFYDLEMEDVEIICETITNYYNHGK